MPSRPDRPDPPHAVDAVDGRVGVLRVADELEPVGYVAVEVAVFWTLLDGEWVQPYHAVDLHLIIDGEYDCPYLDGTNLAEVMRASEAGQFLVQDGARAGQMLRLEWLDPVASVATADRELGVDLDRLGRRAYRPGSSSSE